MKKIFIFLSIVIIIVATISFKYMTYKNEYNIIQKENAEFEEYKDQEIYGLTVGTIINKAVDKNTKNKIEKDENGYFIENEEKYEFQMEQIYNSGTEQFVQYYRDVKFKCSKIEYHEKTGRISYILFEQQ